MAIVGFAELVQYHALLALALGLRVPLVDRLHVFPTCLRTHPRRPRKTHYIAPFGNILSELTGEAWVTFLLIRFGPFSFSRYFFILRRSSRSLDRREQWIRSTSSPRVAGLPGTS